MDGDLQTCPVCGRSRPYPYTDDSWQGYGPCVHCAEARSEQEIGRRWSYLESREFARDMLIDRILSGLPRCREHEDPPPTPEGYFSEMETIGYKNGGITAFGRWWHCRGGMRIRYALGRAYGWIHPYDEEGEYQPWLPRWLGLSGYDPL